METFGNCASHILAGFLPRICESSQSCLPVGSTPKACVLCSCSPTLDISALFSSTGAAVTSNLSAITNQVRSLTVKIGQYLIRLYLFSFS